MDIQWERLRTVVREHVEAGLVPGAVLAAGQGGDVHVEAVGREAFGGSALATDALFRISSMTKPLAAALTMLLVQDGALGLDDPVERWLPELADRQVLKRLDGPPTDTVPALRPITVDDVLTMRMGFGFVLDTACPTVELAANAGLGIGPPDPSNPITPDEWIARLGELPLLHQPGADWMYDLAYGVLGVLLARASGRALDDLLWERLLRPLGMTDTGFVASRARLIPCYSEGAVFDSVQDSRWARRPVFPDPRGGLVSTASDYLRFARLLLSDGVTEDGTRLLTSASVAAMTTDHVGPTTSPFLDGDNGWGYGVEIAADCYGWGGGLGTTWYSYPARDLAVVLLTQCLPPPEPLVSAFWSVVAD